MDEFALHRQNTWRIIRPMRTLVVLLMSILVISLRSAEPPAPPTTTPAPDKVADPAHLVVFITNTGKRYHRESCRYAKIKSTLKDARARGLTPCQICNP